MARVCLSEEEADEFAAGNLDPAAEAAVVAHLRACDACLERAEGAFRLVSGLPLDAPVIRAPRSLRGRVMRASGVEHRGPLARVARGALAAAGVAAVVVAGAAFVGMVSLRGQVDTLRGDNARLQGQIEDALSQKVEILALTRQLDEQERRSEQLQAAARNDRDLWVALLSPSSDVADVISTGEGAYSIGRLVWDEQQKKVWFVATGLRALPAGETYQIWATSDGRYHSLGTFNADAAGFARHETNVPQGMRGYESAVVTIERAGGSLERTGQSVFVVDLSRFRR